MSEGRQLAAILAGLVALAVVGIVGATAFPEPCEGLLDASDTVLRLQDADEVLALRGDDAVAVQGLGEALGIGGWRGAVALDSGDTVHPTEAGFLLEADSDLLVVRPTFGVVSPARDRSNLRMDEASGGFALSAFDGETGVFDGQFEIDHCGILDTGLRRIEIERGLAVVDDDRDTVLVGLDSGERWRVANREARWAEILDEHVVVAFDSEITLHDIRTGEVVDRIEADGRREAGDASEAVLLETDDGLVELTVVDDRLVVGEPVVDDDVLDRITELEATPHGIVAIGYAGIAGTLNDGRYRLVTDRDPAGVALPGALRPEELITSEDGYVGLTVVLDGVRALLVWGPDADDA